MRHSTSNQESLEALAAGDKDHLRTIALEFIRDRRERGTTADEACAALGMVHNSIAPRLTEVEATGVIVKLIDANGDRIRRKTRQGCKAGVYVAAEFASTCPAAPASGSHLRESEIPQTHRSPELPSQSTLFGDLLVPERRFRDVPASLLASVATA